MLVIKRQFITFTLFPCSRLHGCQQEWHSVTTVCTCTNTSTLSALITVHVHCLTSGCPQDWQTPLYVTTMAPATPVYLCPHWHCHHHHRHHNNNRLICNSRHPHTKNHLNREKLRLTSTRQTVVTPLRNTGGFHSIQQREEQTRKNNKMTTMSLSAQKYSPPVKGSGHSNARTVRSGLVLHTFQRFGGLECEGGGVGVRRRCDFLLLLLLLLINKTGKTKRVELWVLNDSMELIAMCPTEDVRWTCLPHLANTMPPELRVERDTTYNIL